MSKRLAILAALAALLGLRCSSVGDTTASGKPGEETTNGVVMGYLYTNERQPAVDASVILSRAAPVFDASLVVETTYSDSSGFYLFESTVEPGAYQVHALARDSSLAMLHTDIAVVDKDTVVAEDTLTPAASLGGSLAFDPPDSACDGVALLNTPFAARVDSEGAFAFRSIPSGAYHVVSYCRTARTLPKVVVLALDSVTLSDSGRAVLAPLQRAEIAGGARQVVLDDFEDGDSCHNQGNRWSCVSQDTLLESSAAFDFNPGADSSRYCARIHLEGIDSSSKGVRLKADFRTLHLDTLLVYGYDLSQLESLAFDVRGIGYELDVKLMSDGKDMHFSQFTLDTIPRQWTTVTVRFPEAIEQLEPWKQQNWGVMKTLVNSLGFFIFAPDGSAPARGNVYIDNIKLSFSP